MAAHLKYHYKDFKFLSETPTIVTCGIKRFISKIKKKDRQDLNMRVWAMQSRCGGTYALTLNNRVNGTQYLALRQISETLSSFTTTGWSPEINVSTILGMAIPAQEDIDPKKFYKILTEATKDADYILARGKREDLLMHLQMAANAGELGYRVEFSKPAKAQILSPVREGAEIPFLDTILEWYKPTRLFYKDRTRLDELVRPHIESFWPDRDQNYHDRLAQGAALEEFFSEKRKLLEDNKALEGQKV